MGVFSYKKLTKKSCFQEVASFKANSATPLIGATKNPSLVVTSQQEFAYKLTRPQENRKARKPILLQLQGYLNRSQGAALLQWVTEIRLDSTALCVLDMANIDWIDSSGLFSLVAVLKKVRQDNCHLVICNLQSSVRVMFEIAQLDRVFDIFESYEDVLAQLV